MRGASAATDGNEQLMYLSEGSGSGSGSGLGSGSGWGLGLGTELGLTRRGAQRQRAQAREPVAALRAAGVRGERREAELRVGLRRVPGSELRAQSCYEP